MPRFLFVVLLSSAVLCCDAVPPDPPIPATKYQASIQRGVVAAWAEFGAIIKQYTPVWPHMLTSPPGAPHPFDHVRLRVSGGDPTFNETWSKLDPPVKDSLQSGLYVLIAYKGWVKGSTIQEAREEIIDWWKTTAEHYANFSHKLAFDIFIEIGGIMCHNHKGEKDCPALDLAKDPKTLNPLYEDIVAAIRQSNPTRVIAMTPGKLDRPWDLHQLVVPSTCNKYCMAEWHIIASGPCSVPSCPNTTGDFTWHGVSGTEADRNKIQQAVNDAVSWSKTTTGLPTWTGAFMCGPYNHPEKGHMTIPEQVGFAEFYSSALRSANIPSAVLTSGVFINETNSHEPHWITDTIPLRNALLK